VRTVGKRTSSSRAMGETPFFLMYEAEAVIPLEVTMVSVSGFLGVGRALW
jgi:hypothetical protein